MKTLSTAILSLLLAYAALAQEPASGAVRIKILPEPLHQGRISPMLYGNFMELLDDVVPGLWAEMLGDRGFEGVAPAAAWCYHTGEPNLADRHWDTNDSWSLDTADAFNGRRSVKITAPGRLTQSDIAVRKGLGYAFSGYFRADDPSVKITAAFRVLLPDSSWATMASEHLDNPGRAWKKLSCTLTSRGTTDRAVFELSVDGRRDVWADELSLVPVDNISGWRRDAVDAVKEMHPPVLRWGGSTIDPGNYKWKNGIGDRDRRPAFLNAVWGRLDMNDVGIDEFIAFCRAVNTEPLICVSFADGAESARELVEYCNGASGSAWGRKRAENGHPGPDGVKYWQIGNELDDASYVSQFPDFARAVRKADPDAKIFSSFPSRELIEKAGTMIDYFCPHYYRSDLQGIDEDIRHLKSLLAASLPGRAPKLAVTEWNINAGNWGLGRGNLNTLGCALFEAQFLNLLHRNSDVVGMACRSNLANSFCGGTVQTNAAGLYRIPAFYVMKLFAEHSKPVPLMISEAPPGLDITACASDDRRSLSLFIVNSTREPVALQIDLKAFPSGLKISRAEAVRDTRDRKQTDIKNFFGAPDRIRTVRLDVTEGGLTLPALSVTAIECARQ
jgi:alpha-N-arabinofuranosidase